MTKKILICGATGFIGRNIAEYYANNDEFEVYGTYFNSKPLKNPNIEMIKVDLTNKKQVDDLLASGYDYLIQAAATTSGAKEIINKPYYHVTDNAIMNSLIFRSAYDYDIGHILFFSCTVMHQSSSKPLKEEDFDANKELYKNYFGVGWTKVYIEKMCEFYSRIGDTKYTAIRHTNIYGPYDKFDLEKSHVFGATMTKVMTTPENGKIVVWGSGEEERDLLYVSNIVDFVDLAIKKQKNKFELYNAGRGESISIKDLVKKIIKHSGKNIEIEYDLSKPTIKTKLCVDITKSKRELGWTPKVSLDQGIEKTIEWYKNNLLEIEA